MINAEKVERALKAYGFQEKGNSFEMQRDLGGGTRIFVISVDCVISDPLKAAAWLKNLIDTGRLTK